MSGITRRKVLAGAAAAGLVGAAPAFAAGVTEKYDVVVVGSGSAGFAAAIRAAEAGSSVILLEVNTWFGGRVPRRDRNLRLRRAPDPEGARVQNDA